MDKILVVAFTVPFSVTLLEEQPVSSNKINKHNIEIFLICFYILSSIFYTYNYTKISFMYKGILTKKQLNFSIQKFFTVIILDAISQVAYKLCIIRFYRFVRIVF